MYMHNIKNYQETVIYFLKIYTFKYKKKGSVQESIFCIPEVWFLFKLLGDLFLKRDIQNITRIVYTCAILLNLGCL